MVPVFPVLLFCSIAIVTALIVVLAPKPVHVAIGLLGHSLSMAGLYFTLDAQFAAVSQMLIYSGAIVVLFLIVVALLPSQGKEELKSSHLVIFILVSSGMIALLTGALIISPRFKVINTIGPTVQEVGAPLFHKEQLLAPFELTAPLLLAAIVAAVVFWRRQESHHIDSAQSEHNPSSHAGDNI